MDELSFDLVAAGLGRDSQDIDTFIEVLANRLQGSMPRIVTIKRGGFFGKDRPVKQLSVQFEQWQYQLNRDKGHANFSRVKLVGGVGIKTETLSLAEWIQGLAQELVQFARDHEETRQALENFLLH